MQCMYRIMIILQKFVSNSREERNLEQLQPMLNMEEQDHRVESSDEDYRSPLNL